MRLFFMIALVGMVALYACSKKGNTPENLNQVPPQTGSVQTIGNFVSNAHTTTGKVSVRADNSGNQLLVFENFKTDNGPDLRVWLSPSTSGSPYVEVGILKAISGNFSYTLPSNANTATNNKVLIWCEDFSVLFGHAILQ